ncbi:MAG: hypothetical protein ACYCZX_03790 [Rhodospirillaceae bacterium]
MSFALSKLSRGRLTAAATALVAMVAAASVSQAQTTIPLSGTAGAICTIAVTPDTAPGHSTSLPITAPGAQTVLVGTVLQSCNLVAGYTLTVASSNCASVPTGAKLIESVSSSNLPFSVNSVNPATGGSTVNVTGLLGSACTAQLARDVTGAAVTGETSTMSVAFTGSATLFPGTYQDTLTFTMTTK